MNEYFRQVNLKPSLKQEFLEIKNKIESFVYGMHPELENSLVWIVHDTDDVFGVFFDGTNTNINVYKELNFNCLKDNIAGLEEFYNDHNLVPAFAKGTSELFAPHRHNFPPTSKWSLTFLLSGSDNTQVNFYKTKEDYDLSVFELPNDAAKDIVCSLDLKENDVYSLNTFEWHDWRTKDKTLFHPRQEYVVFSLRATDIYTRDKILESMS